MIAKLSSTVYFTYSGFAYSDISLIVVKIGRSPFTTISEIHYVDKTANALLGSSWMLLSTTRGLSLGQRSALLLHCEERQLTFAIESRQIGGALLMLTQRSSTPIMFG